MKLSGRTSVVMGQPSWRVATREVEAFLTELGGHLGPVTFKCNGRTLQPFSITPWAKEKLAPDTPTVLRVLRGDFFCMPFGANGVPYKSEKYATHGETANEKWTLEELGPTRLHASLRTKTRIGRVDKYVELREGEAAIYQRHCISGLSGPMTLGHHPMIYFQSEGNISTSRFVFGQVFVEAAEHAEEGGYQSLKPGARFTTLKRVPMLAGSNADLSRYPARRGYEDLAMLVSDPSLRFAWTAVTFPRERYAWFGLKDPEVLRETLFWISNGGRHYPPWNGRHVNVMGLEEVTAYFHYGLAQSVGRNSFRARGYPTFVSLRSTHPLTVNYIMAVTGVPASFDRVASITQSAGGVILRSSSGHSVRVALDTGFLKEKVPDIAKQTR
jgi:hypothetical protein